MNEAYRSLSFWHDTVPGPLDPRPPLPGDLDIDHFVPLANAHASGGWAWDAATKRAYANDLDDPRHLIAVSASANRSKGKKGPEDWVPDHQPYHCEYAYTWTSIKSRWTLTVTNVEHVKLTSLLATCDGTSPTPATPPVPPSTTVPTTSTPTTSTTTSTTTSPTGGDVPANPGNSRNCSDFADYGEAKAWFDTFFPHYGDVARLDNDGDGDGDGVVPLAAQVDDVGDADGPPDAEDPLEAGLAAGQVAADVQAVGHLARATPPGDGVIGSLVGGGRGLVLHRVPPWSVGSSSRDPAFISE